MRKKGCCFLLCFLLMGFLLPQRTQAEAYPYLLTVNLTKNIVTVYERGETGKYTKPVRAFVCSGGEQTPEGTFRTSDKYTWRLLFGNVYGQYATRITGHILFHSVPYLTQKKDTLEYEEYNKLGETASAGCIRLDVADAKWIYDNCPAGTTVRLYRGNQAEPLQPQMPQKIDPQDTLRRGWDPTDPDPQNPWLQSKTELPTQSAAEQPSAEEPQPVEEEPPKFTLQTRQGKRSLTAYEVDGQYFFSAKDCKQIFAYMGKTLILPEKVGAAEQDTILIWYRAAQHEITRCQQDGKAYYSLRELVDLTGVSSTWDGKSMALVGSGEQVLLFAEN